MAVAFRHGEDLIVQRRIASRSHDLRVADSGIPHGDVVGHGVGKNRGLLAHHGHGMRKRIPRHATDVRAIEQDPALPRLHQAVCQARNRRFATAAATHERHRPAWLHYKVEPLDKRGFLGVVSKADATHLEAAPWRERRPRHGCVLSGKRRVILRGEHVFDALDIHAHLRESLQRLDELLGRRGELGKIALERKHHARGELALHDEQQAQRQDKRIGDGARHLRYDAQAHAQVLRAHGLRVSLCLVDGPLAEEPVLCPACLDRLDCLDARQARRAEVCPVTRLHARDLRSLARHHNRARHVDQGCSQAHRREHGGVAHKNDQVDHEHAHVDDERCHKRHKLF